MKRIPRKIFSIYRRNGRYRGVRRTYTSKRVRSNRIFRRFVRRTATKPELKWIIAAWGSGSIGTQQGAPATYYTQAMTPITLNPGTGVGTRIGNQVNFIKVDARWVINDDSNQTFPLKAPARNTFPVRIVVWTPRRPVLQASNHIEQLNIQSQIDFDQVTVLMDTIQYISPTYIEESETNEPAGGPRLSALVIKRSFKFPRKVKFTTGNNDLDPEKDILYVTFKVHLVLNAGITVTAENKTWYFDS